MQHNNKIELTFGITISAEGYGEDNVWKSIDIVATYPDGVKETICCVDYDEEKNLLRSLVFKQGDNDEPVFALNIFENMQTKCPSFISEKDNGYPLCDNTKCRFMRKCCQSAHMVEEIDK